MECKFYPETHEYWLGEYNGEEFIKQKQLISVTQLMNKFGLVKKLNVPAKILQRKAEFGTLVHKEIDDYIKSGQVGFTKEVGEFIEFTKLNDFKPVRSEFIVHNDIVAGTVDMEAVYNGFRVLVDNKTTASYNAEYLSWQLSIYAYLLGEDIDKLGCLWFHDGLQYKEVQFKSTPEILKVMDAVRNNTEYEKPVIVEQDEFVKLKQVQTILQRLEEQKKIYEMQEAEIKGAILMQMKNNGIKSIDNDLFKITYIEPTETKTIDQKRLKEEMPEVAEKYLKITHKSESLRITLKEVENE